MAKFSALGECFGVLSLILTAGLNPVRGVAAEGPRLSLLPDPTFITLIQPLADERIAVGYPGGVDILGNSNQLLRRWPLPRSTPLAFFPDGALLVESENRLMRLRPDGTPDASFASDELPFSIGWSFSPLIQADSGVVFVANSTNTVGLARVDVFGGVHMDFAAATLSQLGPVYKLEVAQQPDGKILVWGQRRVKNPFSGVLLRINADGSADCSFPQQALDGEETSLRISSNGTIAITLWDGLEIRSLLLNADGSLQSVFKATEFIGSFFTPITLLDDGSIVASTGDKVFHFLANGEYKTVQVGFLSYGVYWLIPLPKSRLGLVYLPGQGAGCWGQRFLRILSLPILSDQQLFTWQPPRVPGTLSILAEGLSPDAEYILGVSSDLCAWDYDRSDFYWFERTFDRRAALFQVFARPNEPLQQQQFYALKRRE